MKYFIYILWVSLFFFSDYAVAQCGESQVCNGNTGLYSNDDASSIAYDNMGSAFHASFVKEPNGGWKVWGSENQNNGSVALSPISFTVANYPDLTGSIYKMAIGGDGGQSIVLTSTGLFTVGDYGEVISNLITTANGFHKITVNGKTDGLPQNVGPADVKMLFASTGTLMITTCTGEVYVLSSSAPMRGNGGVGSAILWSQVMENGTTPLSNVIVSRGQWKMGFALKSDGSIWTWGSGTYLGNGTGAAARNYATAMTLPPGMPGIKMIQATSDSAFSYYVLGTDKKVYSLGGNTYGQLGDRTSTIRTSWVNARNPDNSVINDAAWISANEHDNQNPGFSVIRAGGIFYTAGYNSSDMIGRSVVGINYLDLPAGIAATNVITHAEVGGHSTAVIKLGSIRYGYVGHRIAGSMGDGSSWSSVQPSFDFITPPIVAVCGTLCISPSVTTNSPVCSGSTAIFTITGTPGDIVSYSLNGTTVQNTTIGSAGSATVTSGSATSTQYLQLTFVLGATGSCSNALANLATITVNQPQIPTFTQVAAIAQGDVLNPLPTLSNNGISGSWSPAMDNTATTNYTFTPVAGSCATQAQMTIVVNSGTAVPCGDTSVCNGNTGLYSNDDAASIAYDNMGSGFHASFIKEPNSVYKVWGANNSNTGTAVLSPLTVDATNYPGLTGTIYKVAIGSKGATQLIVLTSTGLFAIGDLGIVLSNTITTSTGFHKITVNGKLDGLPANLSPGDVKMLFVTSETIIITSCTGAVYVLSQNVEVRGDGGVGSQLQWSQVMENASTPLLNVIVARGNSAVGFALKSDNSLWTWGQNTLLGNGSIGLTRLYAEQMILPFGIPRVKMIQSTIEGGNFPSYYVLGSDKKVYSLGRNTDGQLGDRTSTDRNVWVNAKNPDDTIITDAAWISANEHDEIIPGFSVIRAGGIFYTAGSNSTSMLGRTIDGGINYLDLPLGIVATDVITHAEVGGHSTAVIKLGSPRYGYVGHRVSGSMGDGGANSGTQQSFDFITPPIIAVCGSICTTPSVTTNSPICWGGNAIFTITGTPGDVVSYSINSGASQTATIDSIGSVAVTVANATTNQSIQLTYVLGGTAACSFVLSDAAIIIVSGNIAPLFTQVQAICAGDPLTALPLTSDNGIAGTWSPPIDNTQTTTYTFTPPSGSCASTAVMTITVHPINTVPTFTQVAPICVGQVLNALPTVSNEGVPGSWSPAMNNQQTTTYTFTHAPANSCVGDAVMTIQVLSALVPLFTQVAPICQGDILNPLPLISTNLISGSWAPSLDNNLTTTYTFTPAANSCSSTMRMTIVVNLKATPTFVQAAPVCEGSTMIALPVLSVNNISGSWSPVLNNTATTAYTFTPVSGACAFTAPMTITVIPKIMPVFATPADVCFGDIAFILPLMSLNGIAGTWSPPFSNTLSGTYTFTPAVAHCAYQTTMQIQIFDDFDFEFSKYCDNGSLMLGIIPKFDSFDSGTAAFSWQSNNVTVGSNSVFNVTSYLNSTPAVELLPISFTTVVTDSNGCVRTKSIGLDNVYCDIQKGISPNNDGFNEFFDLRLLNVKHLSIFNRYGLKVYSRDNYYNEWVGQTDSGTLLPDATYYYVIEFETGVKTGWIYVNRER